MAGIESRRRADSGQQSQSTDVGRHRSSDASNVTRDVAFRRKPRRQEKVTAPQAFNYHDEFTTKEEAENALATAKKRFTQAKKDEIKEFEKLRDNEIGKLNEMLKYFDGEIDKSYREEDKELGEAKTKRARATIRQKFVDIREGLEGEKFSRKDTYNAWIYKYKEDISTALRAWKQTDQFKETDEYKELQRALSEAQARITQKIQAQVELLSEFSTDKLMNDEDISSNKGPKEGLDYTIAWNIINHYQAQLKNQKYSIHRYYEGIKGKNKERYAELDEWVLKEFVRWKEEKEREVYNNYNI